MAWILRFKRFLKKKSENGKLTVSDLHYAEHSILQYVQRQRFGETFKYFHENKSLPKNNSLIKLDPYLDNLGCLRVGGRLQHSRGPFEALHPLILPKNCFVVELIIREGHQLLGHIGRETPVAYLRAKY